MRYSPPGGDLYPGVEARLVQAASFKSVESMVKEVEGIHLKLAPSRALFKLKRDTVRLLNHRDAEALRQEFDLEDD